MALTKQIVQSSVLDSYEVTDKGLVVTVKGTKYLYPTATRKHLQGLENATSKGAYFAKVIAKLESEKLD